VRTTPVGRQAARKAETRARLLSAAAELFAEHGIDAVGVDEVAAAAGRTSGAIYAHFGSKDGLVTALADRYKDEVAAVTEAEFLAHDDRDSQLAALWHNFVNPPGPHGQRWLLLEVELWLAAMRRPELRAALASRYREAREQMAVALGRGTEEVALLMIGLLIGVEMQRRLEAGPVGAELVGRGLAALATVAASTVKGES
jgi:AcrR family transcriptional regulator